MHFRMPDISVETTKDGTIKIGQTDPRAQTEWSTVEIVEEQVDILIQWLQEAKAMLIADREDAEREDQ